MRAKLIKTTSYKSIGDGANWSADVEVSFVEDLIAIMRKHDAPLVLTLEDDGSLEVEIYDDYRE